MSVVLIAMLAGVTSLTGSSILGQNSQETSLATQAARGAMESLRGLEFASVLASFNDDGSDDPAGSNTAPGPHFDVNSLGAQEGDVDGLAGEILLPLTSSGQLVESQNRPEFGLPMDLNGDGSIDSSDRSTDYTLLPVIVRIRWQGRNGDRELQFATILGEG